MTLSTPEAADALAAMRRSQAKMALAAECPPARHLVFAAMLASLTAAPAAPAPGMIVVDLAVMAAVPLVMWWDKRRTGLFLNGYRSGATRPVVFSLLFAQLVIYAISVWVSKEAHVPWGSLLVAPVSFALGWFGSRQWMRVWKREQGVGG